MNPPIKVTIRPIYWRSQPSKYGQIRCYEIFCEYDGKTGETLSVTGDFKTIAEAVTYLHEHREQYGLN